MKTVYFGRTPEEAKKILQAALDKETEPVRKAQLQKQIDDLNKL